MKIKPKTDKKFWTTIIIVQSINLLISSILYFYNYIDISLWITWIAITIPSVAIVYFIDKVQLNNNKENKDDYWQKGYILLGIFAGLVIAFLGPILITILVLMTGGPHLGHVEGLGELWIALLIIGPILGGIIGHLIGKRRGYKPITFFWKIDKFFGF